MDQVRVVLGEAVVEKGCTRLYPPPGGVEVGAAGVVCGVVVVTGCSLSGVCGGGGGGQWLFFFFSLGLAIVATLT